MRVPTPNNGRSALHSYFTNQQSSIDNHQSIPDEKRPMTYDHRVTSPSGKRHVCATHPPRPMARELPRFRLSCQPSNAPSSHNDSTSRSPRWGEYSSRAWSHGLEARGHMRLPFQGRRQHRCLSSPVCRKKGEPPRFPEKEASPPGSPRPSEDLRACHPPR